jgi:3-phenylpropionate/trans-cinnamate dioxygenase ferredoxin reductase subunit
MNAAAALLVVGAQGSAGALTAQLRADRFAGRIVVVGQDPDAPYDRPPSPRSSPPDPRPAGSTLVGRPL